jgi:hypothetical protein
VLPGSFRPGSSNRVSDYRSGSRCSLAHETGLSHAPCVCAARRAAPGSAPSLVVLHPRSTDIAGEVLGEEADQGSLREFYLAIRLRVDYDPSTGIASATVTLDERWGSVSVSEGGLELLSSGDVSCLVRALNT